MDPEFFLDWKKKINQNTDLLHRDYKTKDFSLPLQSLLPHCHF